MSFSTSPDPAVATRVFKLRSEKASAALPHAEFSVFEARPPASTKIKGGLILIQEIFGVNAHIRAKAIHYASLGFITWAPAFFDHIENDVQLDYNAEGITKGREIVSRLGWEQSIEDVKITSDVMRTTLPVETPKIATVGFCWGGSLAWLVACRAPEAVDAAVGYYGRATYEFRHETAKVPVMLHFGEQDASIPMEQVEAFRQAQPDIPVHLYNAGHGFSCDARKDFNPEAARIAEDHTMRFLSQRLGFSLM